ncbi:GDSL-type esterase/lipase family protein [Fodinicola acaciae]|uniref:GDSL-type esterase/lipase family protein n=1 Tax=Fodinicola acaciae TaxID=2681555 RepID=UPI0013D0A45D|nr:GDSL-type esterase/lipase family protein [Fodinicola acaciae]
MATGFWTTSFLTALAGPDRSVTIPPPTRDFADETIRQAVRLCRGGTTVRVELSNEFGLVPLVIDEIRIGATPVPRDGVARWHIPAGATALSDPVPLAVRAGAELSISCYVSGRTGPATYLHSAQRTTEIAPGRQTTASRLVGAQPSPSLYWISRVLVDQPAQGPVIVTIGDSITRGDVTTPDADQRYPDHLQRRLPAGAAVLNAGLGANRVLRPGLGPSMSQRFERDVLSIAEATHVIIMGGINDIALPDGLGEPRPTAAEVFDGLHTLAERAKERGIRPILGTMTPLGDSRYDDFVAAGYEAMRRTVNDAIASQSDWAVVDFAAAVCEPGGNGRLARTYDSGDGLHPNDAGARALADAIDLDLLR